MSVFIKVQINVSDKRYGYNEGVSEAFELEVPEKYIPLVKNAVAGSISGPAMSAIGSYLKNQEREVET